MKEGMTGLELCARLYAPLPNAQKIVGLLEEGDQIAKMIRGLMLKLGLRRI